MVNRIYCGDNNDKIKYKAKVLNNAIKADFTLGFIFNYLDNTKTISS